MRNGSISTRTFEVEQNRKSSLGTALLAVVDISLYRDLQIRRYPLVGFGDAVLWGNGGEASVFPRMVPRAVSDKADRACFGERR